LNKVEGRREIDATDIQIKQTEASAKAREAVLLQVRKNIIDAQNALLRLMADPQLSMLDEIEIIPASKASLETDKLDSLNILEFAMKNNPAIQRAKIETEIADINIRVAENQHMPRLDLVATARTQALARGRNEAQDRLETGEYDSYAIGLSLEYPLGNRQRHAELLKRRLERRRAVSTLQNVADQVAILAKEGITKIETNYSEIQIQKESAEAARIHLKALEDSEPIRERLTPEFLLVKLQAQEALASAQRSEIRAIVEFNISLVQLAQISGTVLQLHPVSTSLSSVSDYKSE
jgi:outer membrane protein TolC